MPSGIAIQNGTNVQHFYTATDQNNNGHVVFAANVDPGATSNTFDLAAGADGSGSVNVQPAGMLAQVFFNVQDNQILTMN